ALTAKRRIWPDEDSVMRGKGLRSTDAGQGENARHSWQKAQVMRRVPRFIHGEAVEQFHFAETRKNCHSPTQMLSALAVLDCRRRKRIKLLDVLEHGEHDLAQLTFASHGRLPMQPWAVHFTPFPAASPAPNTP